MYVLCDTCSVLMLIRIAPDMFTDKRYECVTVPEVRKEFFQTQKFRTKYPWRVDFTSQIKAMPVSELEKNDFEMHLSLISNLNDTGTMNERTGHFFNLSKVDQRIIAYAVTHRFTLNSTDDDLCDFAEQQFDAQITTPLGIINDWLEKGLLEWDSKLQAVIEDWDRCNEHPQPGKEVKKFIKLTGYEYPGQIKR